jgi:hypothetical protein
MTVRMLPVLSVAPPLEEALLGDNNAQWDRWVSWNLELADFTLGAMVNAVSEPEAGHNKMRAPEGDLPRLSPSAQGFIALIMRSSLISGRDLISLFLPFGLFSYKGVAVGEMFPFSREFSTVCRSRPSSYLIS